MENKIQVPPSKKSYWSGKIENKEEALRIIKYSSNGLYFLAALQIILGYFFVSAAIIDGVVSAIFAFLLRKFNNRVVAVILLLLSIAGLVVAVVDNISSGAGVRGLFLSVIMIWVSVRVVQATFAIKRFQQVEKL